MPRGVRTAGAGTLVSADVKDSDMPAKTSPDMTETDGVGNSDLDTTPIDSVALLEEFEALKKELAAMKRAVKENTTELHVQNVPADVFKAAEAARVRAEADANTSNTTIPGGCYLVDGEWVNAFNDIIDPETGKIKVRRHKPIDGSYLFKDVEE